MSGGVIIEPFILRPDFDKIPELLRSQPRWVMWKIGEVKPDGRYGKIPCNSRTAKNADVTDSRNWLSFEDAKLAYEAGGFAGIGIVLDERAITTADNGEPLYLIGIDIDHCVVKDADGKPALTAPTLDDWRLLGKPYWEYSPSQTGLRMFGVSRELLKNKMANGNEMYTSKRFLTVTGSCGKASIGIKDITEELISTYKRWFGTDSLCSKPAVNNSAYVTDKFTPPPETKEEVARVQEMLSFISADRSYEDYRNVIWGIESTGWGCCESLGREWSMTANHRFDESSFQQLRGSYKTGDGITIGTLIYMAKQAGWKPKEQNKDALAAVQHKFALITLGGKIGVVDWQALEARNTDGTAARLEVINRVDGGLLVERFIAREFPQVDAKKQFQTFLRDKHTTLYNGVAFNPRDTTPNVLNLWVGATITPKSGNWPLIRTLLLEILCGGRESEYQYLIHYIAHAIQRPYEKPGVMIILLGGQGIGKGTLARILQKIWSATFLQVNRIKQVVGDFNGSLERAYIVFLDEALFAGDRASSDALKSLVTEQTISINEKHQPARQITSYHRFFSATNADWFKNTERDDRRDFVLRVSEHRKGDFAFWDALNAEIEHGGVEAFAHDLLELDLTDFNVRIKPNTRELTEQKLQSLDKFPRWWFDCLSRGAITQFNQEWPDFVSTATLLTEFKESEKCTHTFKRIIERDITAYILKLCPTATREQGMEGINRRRGYRLPTLEGARECFEQFVGDSISWEDGEWATC